MGPAMLCGYAFAVMKPFWLVAKYFTAIGAISQ